MDQPLFCDISPRSWSICLDIRRPSFIFRCKKLMNALVTEKHVFLDWESQEFKFWNMLIRLLVCSDTNMVIWLAEVKMFEKNEATSCHRGSSLMGSVRGVFLRNSVSGYIINVRPIIQSIWNLHITLFPTWNCLKTGLSEFTDIKIICP